MIITTIIAGFKGFGQGVIEGIDMWQQITKQPRWVCWLLGLLTMPFNILILIGILFAMGYEGLRGMIDCAKKYINEGS
jgi:hypothetical protein